MLKDLVIYSLFSKDPNMNTKKFPTARPVIGTASLAMLNIAIVCTLRGLPIMAEEGLSLIFYLIIVALVFLIPVSLISAELATGWPPHGPGGVYIWVSKAFGPRLGFLAIWLQWIQNVVWFPTILSFVGATLAYLYDPKLVENKIYMVILILSVYWGGTFLNFRGMKTSGLLSSICVIIGTIIPGIIIVGMGVIWFMTDQPIAIDLSFNKLIPDLSNIHNIVFLAGAVLIFAGMEVSAVHSQEVVNPKKTYPRAIMLATIVALSLLMLGSLSIAIVVPQKDLSLVGGVMETFKLFFDSHNLKWAIPVVAVLIAAGAIGELSAWIIGPAKGLMVTAEHGNLPPFLQKVTKQDVPTNILLIQAGIVTVLSLIFLLMPNVSSSYWILSAFSVLLYLLMYVIVFVAAIRLRYSHPDVVRAYKIPCGNIGMWIVAGIGIIGALFTITIGFLPPSQISIGSPVFYEAFLIIGTIVMCIIPFIILLMRKPSWRSVNNNK